MKSKAITKLVLLSLLCLVAIPMVRAEKPYKLIVHEVYEGGFPLPPEDPTAWCKAVLHGTMINKGVVPEEGYNVVMYMLQKIILYEYEGGDIVAVLKLNMHYVGTVTDFESEKPFETLHTGKLVLDIVLNELKEGILPQDKPQQSHWVVWYEDCEVDKYKGFGEPLFP